MAVNVRLLALSVVQEVLEHHEYLSRILPAVLDKYGYLPKQDRAFLTRLTTGTIEREEELIAILRMYSSVRIPKLDPVVKAALMLGLYQILYMDSVPVQAAVDESVKLVKKSGKARLGGYTNGVLRSILRDYRDGEGEIKGRITWKDEKGRPQHRDLCRKSTGWQAKKGEEILSLCLDTAMPVWIGRFFEKSYGLEKTKEILTNLTLDRPLTAAVHTGKITAEELIEKLSSEGAGAQRIEGREDAIRIEKVDRLDELPSFVQGLFYMQDLSSMEPVRLAGIKEGMKVADLCASPGGKSLMAALACKESGQVLSFDQNQEKVDRIMENATRYGLENIKAFVADATCPNAMLSGKMDVILCDVPCSGLGVMGRKPEIRSRLKPEDLEELAQIQQKILTQAAAYLVEGGTLVYSTCTINPSENEENVSWFLQQNPQYHLVEQKQIWPDQMHDGFFVAVMKKEG
ncbi:MAG: 16S rRNA (cytosine(967)-C(5))-methyltransferase RsmB [Lachnospiraceae bacterium]|nr:16S rRNA (cytosine(967)-C(5))-methyltransferase RsmB [Lachnospiraceae bacterium]